MLSTLDFDVIKDVRPARVGAYTEDYPPPLNAGDLDYELDFSSGPLRELVRGAAEYPSNFRITYYPSTTWSDERAALRGNTTHVEFEFQYDFSDGSWREPDEWYRTISERYRLVSPARVCSVLRDFVDTIKRNPKYTCFDAETLNAVGALPPPIAEQVAWHLAPPTLEDSLLRRGTTSP